MAVYECDGCGVCCGAFPIFASKTDADREPRILAETPPLAREVKRPGWSRQLFPLPFLETCGFLDETKRCTIYATRPDVCREFAAGAAQCQLARRRAGLAPLEPKQAGEQ